MSLTLTSPAFADGEAIPQEYGREYRNVNPPLSIDGVPTEAVSLALAFDDPDALEVAGTIWDHWVLIDLPPDVSEIEEGSPPVEATEGTNDFDEVGYDGPAPPEAEHTYRFRLFALDEALGLDSNATIADVEDAAQGHLVDSATLTGTFAP